MSEAVQVKTRAEVAEKLLALPNLTDEERRHIDDFVTGRGDFLFFRFTFQQEERNE